jgi:hypothetical protein
MESCLTGIIYEDAPLKAIGLEIYDAAIREVGMDWPSMPISAHFSVNA